MLQYRWLWGVPVLLLAAWLGARGLDTDAYWYDEGRSMIISGAAHYGPFTLAETWQNLSENDTSIAQLPGYPLLLSQWGQWVGWSEVATRSMALFFGVLAVAWTYRAGTDLISRTTGLSAALFLASSAYFTHFFHELRAFSLLAACAACALWAYWRLMLDPRTPGWGAGILLLLAGLGLIYGHYFGLPVLAAIGLYHLFFAPKTRRWWWPTGVAVAVGLLFLPWLPVAIRATQVTTDDARLSMLSFTPLELIGRVVVLGGNHFGWVFGAGLLLAGFALFRTAWPPGKRLILFYTVTVLILLIVLNEITEVVATGRERYLIVLWPGLALVFGMGFAWLIAQRRAVGWGVLGLWAVIGIWGSLDGRVVYGIDGTRTLPMRDLQAVIAEQHTVEDVAAFHAPEFPWGVIDQFRYYTYDFPFRSELIESLESEQVMAGYIADAQRVWLGIDQRSPATPLQGTFETVLDESGYALCATLLNTPDVMALRLYARHAVYCPGGEPLAQFGGGIHLIGIETDVVEDRLNVHSSWTLSDDVPLNTYSVAWHALDEDGTLVAQADVGLPGTAFGIIDTSVDLTGVPAGEHTLHAIVYNWQTGERLLGQSLVSDASGERIEVIGFRR